MLLRWSGRLARRRRLPPSATTHHRHLVNIKLHRVKDRTLDSVITRDRNLRPVLQLASLLASDPHPPTPSHLLSCHLSLPISSFLRRFLASDPHPPTPSHLLSCHLSLPISSFLRRFPALFSESPAPGTLCFQLTPAALHLHQQNLHILSISEPDLINRLRKLLMLTADRALPLHTIDQLSWDLGLPTNYHKTLIPRYPQFFELLQPTGDERIWVRLLEWDPRLAVSALQTSYGCEERLAFPISFTRGFGLKRKCLSWLAEWQTLPYTSPYAGTTGLDPRTDVSEKRIVGVFHELLQLTITKKTERRNVSNLRRAFELPQKFTKVFERHPGIFYLSEKLGTQTVVLREAFGGGRELLEKHPLIRVRERCAELMREGMAERRWRVSSSELMENVNRDGEHGYDSNSETGDVSNAPHS